MMQELQIGGTRSELTVDHEKFSDRGLFAWLGTTMRLSQSGRPYVEVDQAKAVRTSVNGAEGRRYCLLAHIFGP